MTRRSTFQSLGDLSFSEELSLRSTLDQKNFHVDEREINTDQINELFDTLFQVTEGEEE
jgi:hypothetical protein